MNQRNIARLCASVLAALTLCGCGSRAPQAQIAATTLPVYDFTARLCDGTGLTVTRLVTEQVSCLHDYSLSVRQVQAAEAAQVVVISGAGLEDFLEDILDSGKTIDASAGIELLSPAEPHSHDEHSHHDHHHDEDPHIWLSPANAKAMAETIFAGLSEAYPAHAAVFRANLAPLLAELDALQAYGEEALAQLGCRELITFHDGFSYLAQAFDLTILAAVEEESGSEASARELIELIGQVRQHDLPAVFCEANGSRAAAQIIAAETDAGLFTLDMAMGEGNYLDTMYQNIAVLKEALG